MKLLLLSLAAFWVWTAYIFLNHPKVNKQVLENIEDAIRNAIQEGKLKGASIEDIDRIRNRLSIFYTFGVLLGAPFFFLFSTLRLVVERFWNNK